MSWYEESIVTDLRVANYLIDHGCELIELEAVPARKWQDAQMRLRGEDLHQIYREAAGQNLPPLTAEEYHRLDCMLALLACVLVQKQKEAAEEVRR